MTERHYVIPTQPGMGRGLVNHDERSKNFRAVNLIPPDVPTTFRTKAWRRGRAYNQHQTPHCVAYTGKGILNTVPRSRLAAYLIRSRYNTTQFYTGAQNHDEWEGQAYDGTSGLGLCRYLASIGLIDQYLWCFGLSDVLRTLSWLGPIGLGIMWPERFFRPDSNGYLELGGGDAGGHEIEITGIDPHDMWVEITNSWGTNWGNKGRARIRWPVLEDRLEAHGDAFIVTT